MTYVIIIVVVAFIVLLIWQSSQIKPDPTKEPMLARTPIGCYVQNAGTEAGMTSIDITIRNNSGKFINNLYIEVLAYDGAIRVGNTNHIFSSVNVGETMITRNFLLTSGRPWNNWKFTYQVY